uniref:hypothetical protein n=1 Tax=uncultured Draconibacterium sp. TaxID=1573823 RepID=UPI003217ACC0
MKNIEYIPTDAKTAKKIRLLRDKLLATTGISVDVLEFKNNTVRLRVEQKELKNGFILNQSQLVHRAAVVLAPLNDEYKLHYVALTYQPNFDEINADWINERIKLFKLSRNDILKQMGLDKSTLSVLLSGEKRLTRFQRAAFYYYFLTYELNRDFREHLNED